MDDESDESQSTPAEEPKAELVQRAPDGKWRSGAGSPNPGGLTKEEREANKVLAAVIRNHPDAPKLVNRLFVIALQGSISNPTTVRAIEVLQARGWGKEPIKIDVDDPDGNGLRVGLIILPGAGQGGGE